MDDEAQCELPWLLQHLVVVHADEEGVTGRRMARSQAAADGQRQLVQSLVDARLLVSELAFGEPVVSVAHEALLRHWPRVVDWIDGNRAALQTRTRLSVLAQRWQRETRRRDLLLPQGRLLEEARALLGNPVVSLTDEELVFIDYSSRQAQWARRARMSMISLVALLGITAAVAAGLASRAKQEADRRRAGAENLIGFMLGDLSERLKPLGRLDLLDRVSSEALRYLADDAKTEANRPRDSSGVDSDADLYRAKALLQLGGIRLARADQVQAQLAFSGAMSVLQHLHDRSPKDTDVLGELGKANYWLGYIRYRQHDMPHAEEAWRRYREYAEQRMALDPRSVDAMLELSYAYNNLGTLESSLGSKDDAIANFRKSIGLKRQVLDLQPTNDDVTVELADSLSWVGTSLEHEGKLLDAGKYYQQEFDLLRQARVVDPAAAVWRFREANAHSHIANLAVKTGDFVLAQTHYEAARDILTDIVSKQPDNRSWQASLAVLKIELGELHLLTRQPDATQTLLADAIPTMKHLVQLDASVVRWKRQLALAHRVLALARAQLGQAKAAREEALHAVGIMQSAALVADDDPVTRSSLAQALIVLGKIEQAGGDNDAAAGSWHRAFGILAGLVPHSSDLRILVPWAQLQICLHRDDLAAPFIYRLQSRGYREPIDPPLHY
jgi:tetratricopeptide (TPR) repeat protein